MNMPAGFAPLVFIVTLVSAAQSIQELIASTQSSTVAKPAGEAGNSANLQQAGAPSAPNEDNPDFELTLGIGSLINNAGSSDYTDQNNILNSTNLGRASPQYLVGISLRTPFSNFHRTDVSCQARAEIKRRTAKQGELSECKLLPSSRPVLYQ